MYVHGLHGDIRSESLTGFIVSCVTAPRRFILSLHLWLKHSSTPWLCQRLARTASMTQSQSRNSALCSVTYMSRVKMETDRTRIHLALPRSCCLCITSCFMKIHCWLICHPLVSFLISVCCYFVFWVSNKSSEMIYTFRQKKVTTFLYM